MAIAAIVVVIVVAITVVVVTRSSDDGSKASGSNPNRMSTITEQDFRAEATSFLDAHAARRGETKEFVWGEGSDNVSILEEKSAEQEAADMAENGKDRKSTRLNSSH